MSDIQINNTPSSGSSNSGMGLVVGVILAIIVVLAFVWFVVGYHPFSNGPTIINNNPASQPAQPGTSSSSSTTTSPSQSQPATPAPAAGTSSQSTSGSAPVATAAPKTP